MSRAGAQAVVLPTAAPCRWPCRPSAWASRLFIGFWSIWSCAPRRSSNGSHWVLSILGFSPRTWAAAAARRLGDNAVQVREAGFTCRASPPYGKQCSLSRSSFRSVNMKKGAKAPRAERADHHRESHTLWFNAPLADAQRRPPLTRQRVVAEALTVIAQDGVEALTMRTLAARLGVVPGALYRHVRNKEQLHDLVLDAVLAEVDATSTPPSPGPSSSSCSPIGCRRCWRTIPGLPRSSRPATRSGRTPSPWPRRSLHHC